MSSLAFRFAVTGALVVLSAILGIILRALGRPLNPPLATVHKLVGIAALIVSIVAVRIQQKAVGLAGPTLAVTVIYGLFFLFVIASGALLTSEKLAGVALRAIHAALTVLLAASVPLLYWLFRSTGGR